VVSIHNGILLRHEEEKLILYDKQIIKVSGERKDKGMTEVNKSHGCC
jgi:hypothetical protein